jgi:hypothetical protein
MECQIFLGYLPSLALDSGKAWELLTQAICQVNQILTWYGNIVPTEN